MEDKLFSQVLIETLEAFAFQFADARERPVVEELGGEMFWMVRLCFKSDQREGSLRLCMPVPLSREITMSVMGAFSDEDVTDVLVADAMKECANIVAGSFTAARFGVEEVFSIGHPDAELCQPEVILSFFDDSDETAYLQVDDYIVIGGYRLGV